jgi:2-iminobutanoate/2-iminopropanoate deaminase
MRQVIQTDKAPAAIGPYSQAIRVEPFLFTAGQIGLDPASGKLVPGGVEEEAKQVLRNLEAVLKAAGGGFEHVVKTTIFLASMEDFGRVNQIYAEVFGNDPPARSTVAVAALPAGAQVEIDVIARF